MKEFTSRGSLEESWCAIKHALHQEGHLEEMMSNSAREGDDQRVVELSKMLDETRARRQKLVKMATGQDTSSGKKGCDRCRDDLDFDSHSFLNKESHIDNQYSGKTMAKEIMKYGSGAIAGVVGLKVADYIVKTKPTIAGMDTRPVANIGGGVLVYAVANTKVGRPAKNVLKLAGTIMVSKGIYDLVTGYTEPRWGFRAAPPMASAAPTGAVAPSAALF